MGKSSKRKSRHKSQHEGKVSPTPAKSSSDLKTRRNKDFESDLKSLKARLTGPKRKKEIMSIPLSQPTFRAPSSIRAEEEERAALERKKSANMEMDSLFEEPDKRSANVARAVARTSSINAVQLNRNSRFSVLDVDGEEETSQAELVTLAAPILQMDRSDAAKGRDYDDDDDL